MAERDNTSSDTTQGGVPTTVTKPESKLTSTEKDSTPKPPVASSFKHGGGGLWTNPDGWMISEQHGSNAGWAVNSPDNEVVGFWPKGGDGWDTSKGSVDQLAGLNPTALWQKSLD